MDRVIIPAMITTWLAELKNPKNSDFQKDLYRQRLEAVRDHINTELAIPSRSTDKWMNKKKTR